MLKKTKICFSTLFLLAFFISLTAPVSANQALEDCLADCAIEDIDCLNNCERLFAKTAENGSWFGRPLIPEECTQSPAPADPNACGLSAMFQMIVNVSDLLLALTGSVALLMFMYGGVRWILSAGKQEWVAAGQAAMAAATIGIIIILTSWLIVNFTIIALTGGQIGGQAMIFSGTKGGGQVWFSEKTFMPQTPGADWPKESAENPPENYPALPRNCCQKTNSDGTFTCYYQMTCDFGDSSTINGVCQTNGACQE